MRVTVVGSGDAFGSGGRFQTCIALGPDDTAAASHTLVDCGATSLVALKQQGFDPTAIETVVITHLHGDHFGGLPFLILDGQFRRRTRDLTVIGPPGTRQRLDEALEVCFPGSSGVRRRFTVDVVEHRERTPHSTDRLTATPFEVRHAAGVPAYAIRIQDDEGTARLAPPAIRNGPAPSSTPPKAPTSSSARATHRHPSAGTSIWRRWRRTATASPHGVSCSPTSPRQPSQRTSTDGRPRTTA